MDNFRATKELVDINSYVSNTVIENAAVKAAQVKQIDKDLSRRLCGL